LGLTGSENRANRGPQRAASIVGGGFCVWARSREGRKKDAGHPPGKSGKRPGVSQAVSETEGKNNTEEENVSLERGLEYRPQEGIVGLLNRKLGCGSTKHKRGGKPLTTLECCCGKEKKKLFRGTVGKRGTYTGRKSHGG